jgi:hypothetical protein
VRLEYDHTTARRAVRIYSAVAANHQILRNPQDKNENIVGGAAVCYLAIGRLAKDLYVSRGVWNLTCSKHALGRIIERDPRADLAAVLRDAHGHLMAIRDVLALDRLPFFLVPAAGGVFVCGARLFAPHEDDPPELRRDYRVSCYAFTWLSADMRWPEGDYPALCSSSCVDNRSWWLPLALRTVEITDDTITAIPTQAALMLA